MPEQTKKQTLKEAMRAAVEAAERTTTSATTKQTVVSKAGPTYTRRTKSEQSQKPTLKEAMRAAVDAADQPELSRQITPIGAQTPQSSTAAPTVSTEITPFSEYTAQNRQRRREAMQAAVDAVSPKNARKTMFSLQADADVQKQLRDYSFSLSLAGDRNAQLNRENEMKSMQDDERALYLYLIKNRGIGEAEEYRKELGLSARALPEVREAAENAGFLGKLGIAAVSGFTDAIAGNAAAADALRGRTPLNNPLDAVSGTARESINSGVGKTVFDLVKTTANQLPAMAMGYATGFPGLQTVLMSTSAGGGAYKQALAEGMTKEQATKYGVINGLSEYLTEALVGVMPGPNGKIDLADTAKEAIAKNVDSAVGRFAANFGVNFLGEATEEYLQEVLDPLFRYIATGEAQDWNISELWSEDALYSALLGGLSGGMLGGIIDGINGYRAESDYNYYQAALDSGEAVRVWLSEDVAARTDVDTSLDIAKDAEIAPGTAVTEETVQQVALFAEATQTPVLWVKPGVLPSGINAQEAGGVVFLSADANKPLEALLAHETLHSTEGTQAHTALLEEVDAAIRAENPSLNLDSVAEQYQQNCKESYNENMTIEAAKNEVAAQYVESNLPNSPLAMQLIMSRNSGLIREIAAKWNYRLAYRQADEAGRRSLRLQKDFAEGLRQRQRPTAEQIERTAWKVNNGMGDAVEVRYSKGNNTSSIKEQLRSHIDEINAMDPVAEVHYTPQNKKDLKAAVMEYFRTLGFKVDRQGFGTIEIGETQVNKSLEYIGTDAEKAALLCIPKVLKRGKNISGHDNHKKRAYDTITIAAPVVINGNRGNVAAVVRLTGKNRYHTHRILMPDGSEFVFNTKKDTEPTSADMLAGIGDQGTAISSVSDPTIPQGTADVNTQYTQDSEKYSRTGESFASLMEQMEEKIKQYGGMELPGREIEVPKSVEEGTFVSRAASTLLNDPKIKGNEEAKGVGIRGIVEGDYNRKRMNLDEALRKSKESIQKLGYDNVVAEMRDRITDGSVLNEREMARYMTLREEAIAAGDWDAVQDCNVLIANSLTSSARNMTLARRLLEGLDGEHTAKADQRALESRNEKAAERARKERGNVPQETIDRMRGKKAEMEKDYRQAETESTEKRNAVRDLRRHLNDLQKGIDHTVSDQKRTDKQTPKLAKELAQKMQDAVAATDSLIASEEKFQKTKQELHNAKMELNRLKRQTKANERAEYQYLWDMLLINERLETAVEEQRQSAEKLRETKKELDRSKEYRKLKGDLQKLGAGIEIPQAMWDELKAAKTPEEIEAAQARIFKEAADQLPPTLYERFMSWRYLAMLGNPKTWIKNEVGNLANYGLHKLDDTIAYALQKFFLKEGNRIVALNWRHTDEGKAIMDKVNEAADAATEREGSHKYTDAQSQIQDYRKRFNSNFLEKMSDGLDTALNEGSVTALTGGRVKLGAGDKPMFRANYVEALGNYMVANSLAEVTAEADAYATKVAQDYVFHTQNVASEVLTKFRNSGKVQKIIVDSLMPFIRTPANVLAQGLQRSPVGFAAAATKLAKAFAAQKRGTGSVTPEIINNMARSATGAVLFTLGAILSAVGVASGDEEGDDAKGRAAGELSGAQDLSFNILGTRISFDWLEPASYPFLLGVLMQDGFSQDNPVGSLLDAASAGFGQVFEMSMLSGVLNAVNSHYGDAGDSVAQAVTSVFESAATQSIPTLVGQLARAVDPVKRKTTSGESWITDALGKNLFSDTASTLAARIPGLSKTLEPERDVWGNEVGRVGDAQAMLLNAFQQLLSPAAIKVKGSNGEQADDLSAILADLYEKTEQGKVIPTELKAKDFKKKLDDEGLMDRYTSTLYQETREDVGKAQLEALWEMIDQNKAVKLTKTYKTANGEKKRESYTKRFADMDGTEKAKAVQKTAQDAKKELLEELLLELEKGAKKK